MVVVSAQSNSCPRWHGRYQRLAVRYAARKAAKPSPSPSAPPAALQPVLVAWAGTATRARARARAKMVGRAKTAARAKTEAAYNQIYDEASDQCATLGPAGHDDVLRSGQLAVLVVYYVAAVLVGGMC